jgi:hypothetical protein
VLPQLIQSLLLLAFCTVLQSSQNSTQQAIVRSLLSQKHKVSKTPTINHPHIEPLPNNLRFHRPTIRANHIKELCDTNKIEQAYNSYDKTYIPDDLSLIPNPKTRKAYESINASIKKTSYKNSDAQLSFIEKSVQRLSPILEYSAPSHDIVFTHMQNKYAFELLDFTLNLDPKIDTLNHINKDLVELRNNSDPVTAYIAETIRYVQANNETQKNQRFAILNGLHCPENPEIVATCQFLINYGDNTLSAEDAAKKYIQTICSQKGLSNTLSKIACTPLCSHVMRQLEAASFEKNDPILPNFYYVVAELYYKCKNYTKARDFYLKNKVTYLKEKKITTHAFETYIATTATFDKDDLTYLASLVGNVGNQLQQLDKTDQTLSYHIGLVTHALIQHNSTMSSEEKRSLLHNGLDHLTYAHKTTELTAQFHTWLSDIYAEKNDSISALKHLKYASHSNEIITILTNAEQTNAELYNKLAPWITIMLNFIEGRQQMSKPKNYTLLHEFVSSDLCAQLLPYCQRAHKTHTNLNNDVLCMMALTHKNSGNYALACHYIEQLSHPIANAALPIKASIYAASHKQLSDAELETIIKLFIKNKKPSPEEQKTILSFIIPCHTFFLQKENYKLALKLIIELMKQQSTPAQIIQLAYIVSENLMTDNNAYADQWFKELAACQFYNKIQDPSCYDGDTNFAAGVLLMANKPIPNYERMIAHFTAAIASTTLPLHMLKIAEDMCATLYYDWAVSMRHDTDVFLNLINQAMHYDKSGIAQYEKALFILHNSNDKNLINDALELLKENITKNNIFKETSQLQLAHAYLNYSPNPARLPIMRECIPLDIDKAIAYLTPHNNNKHLLDCLVNIFSGSASYIDDNLKSTYLNLEKAISYLTILIETNPHDINYITQRIYLHGKMNNPTQAIEDIDRTLSSYNFSQAGITKAQLLQSKLKFLLNNPTLENSYDQVLECIKQLQTDEETRIPTITLVPNVQELTHHFISDNNMSDKAIEWCCVTAEAHMAALQIAALQTAQPHPAQVTEAQKELAHYLFAAAKKGNLDAQLTILPYIDAINYHNTGIDHISECLRYNHAVLLNPHNGAHKAKTARLIQYLRQFTEEGIALAYYILCDYYKKDTQQLEKIMLNFSKAQKHHHHLNDTSGIIEKIAISCKDTFTPYIKRYESNTKKKTLKKNTLIDTLATHTFGSMCHYNKDLSNDAAVYLGITLDPLCGTFKLPHYKQSTQLFLADKYYKKALETKNDTESVELFKQSVHFGLFAAAHKLAQLYIQQHHNGKNNVLINIDDFFPMLTEDVTKGNPPHPDSVTLYQECLAIKNKNDNNSLQAKTVNAVDSQQSLPILRAINYLKGDGVQKNYTMSEKFLTLGLSSGIVTQQFCNQDVVKGLCDYIKELLTQPHPRITKQNLLSKIKKTLKTEGVNHAAFCEAFQKITTIDLLSKPEWVTESKSQEIQTLTTFKNRLIQDMNREETCASYIRAEQAFDQGNMKEGLNFTQQAASENDSDASIFLVYTAYLEADQKNEACDNKVHALLKQALTHGIINRQFYSESLLDKLYVYMEAVLCKSDQPIFKQCTLSTIKSTLETKGVNITLFTTIFKETTGIDLPSIPEWSTEKKEKEESIIQYPNYQETPAFLDMKAAFAKGDINRAFELAKDVAEKEHNPVAHLYCAAYYLQKLQKNALKKTIQPTNIKLSEKYLKEALKYGLAPKQFCTYSSLKGFCDNIDAIIRVQSETTQRTLLSTIKKGFETKEIDLVIFNKIFQDASGIDLSTIPAWNT